jgi:hypothetical protein
MIGNCFLLSYTHKVKYKFKEIRQIILWKPDQVDQMDSRSIQPG